MRITDMVAEWRNSAQYWTFLSLTDRTSHWPFLNATLPVLAKPHTIFQVIPRFVSIAVSPFATFLFLSADKINFHSLSPPHVPSLEYHNVFEVVLATPFITLAVISFDLHQRTAIPIMKATVRRPYGEVTSIGDERNAFLELSPDFGSDNVDVGSISRIVTPESHSCHPIPFAQTQSATLSSLDSIVRSTKLGNFDLPALTTVTFASHVLNTVLGTERTTFATVLMTFIIGMIAIN
jgi:hypothetical protein